MKRKILLLTILTTLFGSISFAAPGVVKGIILNEDNSTLAYANVTLEEIQRATTSNQKGEYKLDNIHPGEYTLVVSFVGFPQQKKKIAVRDSSVVEQNFSLSKNDYTLNEVIIAADRNKYKVNSVSPSLKMETPLLNIPQNIQVVSQALLAEQQITSILEGVTRNVSGVTRLEHWDTYALINMRGSQIAAFRNGMNVQMPWGPLAEDMSMVERIEFVKGPAGFMMANGEPSGFYNVVTKKPTGIKKGEVTMTLGSYDTYRSTLDLDGKIKGNDKLLYRVNVMAQSYGSHRPYEWNDRYTIAPVIKYIFNDKTSLTAEYTYQYSKMSVVGSQNVFSPKGYEDLPVDFTASEPNLDPTVIKDHSFFLTLNHQISNNWKFTGQLAYFNFNQVGSSLWPSALDADGTLHRELSIWDAFNESKLGQLYVNGKVKTGNVTHQILGGLDMNKKNYIADWGQKISLEGSTPFNIYNPVYGTIPAASLPEFDRSLSLRKRAGTNIVGQTYSALYLQDELHFFDDILRLTLAGRYTKAKSTSYGSNTDDKKFTPRVGLSASLDKQTSFYALYDQAFVPQTGTDYNGKAFEPITGNNTEFGIKRDWFGGKWNTTVAAYKITKNNVLTSDTEHINFSTQLGQTQTKGVEVDVKGEIIKGLNLILNYAFTDSEVTKDADSQKVGNPLAGTTKHITNAWLSYAIQDGVLKNVGLSLGYQWQLDRSSWYVFDGSNHVLPDYFRLDGGISWKNKNLSVALNVNNILDAYLYSGSPYGNYYYWQTEAPRNFRVNIAYKF